MSPFLLVFFHDKDCDGHSLSIENRRLVSHTGTFLAQKCSAFFFPKITAEKAAKVFEKKKEGSWPHKVPLMLDAVNSGGTCRILFFLAVKIDKLYFRFSQVSLLFLCLSSKSRSFRFHVWI